MNVGREQGSAHEDFRRPVLVFRKFTEDIFLGVPFTTKVTGQNFRCRCLVDGHESEALIFHMREYDRRRLIQKVATMEPSVFQRLRKAVLSCL